MSAKCVHTHSVRSIISNNLKIFTIYNIPRFSQIYNFQSQKSSQNFPNNRFQQLTSDWIFFLSLYSPWSHLKQQRPCSACGDCWRTFVGHSLSRTNRIMRSTAKRLVRCPYWTEDRAVTWRWCLFIERARANCSRSSVTNRNFRTLIDYHTPLYILKVSLF